MKIPFPFTQTMKAFWLLIASFIFSACSLVPQNDDIQTQQALLNKYPDISTRIAQVSSIDNWAIAGKLAFIETTNKQSASFNWRVNKNEQTQQLDLTSFLGINVLHLESNNGIHVIEVSNQTYKGTNLDHMLQTIANITLPTEALSYWIRGINYLPNDHITYDEKSHLPKTLHSVYEGQKWQVDYLRHQTVSLPSSNIAQVETETNESNVALANKVSITTNNLTIKLNINRWHLL